MQQKRCLVLNVNAFKCRMPKLTGQRKSINMCALSNSKKNRLVCKYCILQWRKQRSRIKCWIVLSARSPLKTAFQDSKNVQQLNLTHVTKTFVVILAAVLLLIELTIQSTTKNYILVLVGIPNIISQLPLCVCSYLTQSAQIQACCVWYNSVLLSMSSFHDVLFLNLTGDRFW